MRDMMGAVAGVRRGSLRSRIYLVIAICACQALVGGLVALLSLRAVNTNVATMNHKGVGALAQLSELRDMEGDTREQIWEYLAAAPADRAEIAEEMDETDEQMDQAISGFLREHGSTTDASGRLMAEFVRLMSAWRDIRDHKVRPLADRGDLQAAYQEMHAELEPADDAFSEPLDELHGREVAESAARTRSSGTTYRGAVVAIVAITLGGLALAVLVALALTRRVLATVRRIGDVVMSGDVTRRVGPTGDSSEIGDLAEALDGLFDIMVHQQQALDSSHAAREAQLNAAYIRQRLGEREVRRRAQTLVDDTSEAVIAELGEVLGQADLVRSAAGEIEQRAAHAEEMTRAVVLRAQGAEQVVDAVSESLQRVDGITGIIAGVASQTNLLALNATIEAARAGAAGKGFAVVADEVKGLAANTRKSTAEITSTVGTLRGDAAAMASTITAMAGGVDGISDAARTVTETATRQREAVETLDRCVAEVMSRIRTMSQFSNRLERRRHERVGVTGAVGLRFAGRCVEARMHDLSRSGILCVGDAATLPGVDQQVELVLNLGDHQHVVQARVMRRVPREDGEGVGLEFTSLAADVGAAVDDFIRGLLHDDEVERAEADEATSKRTPSTA